MPKKSAPKKSAAPEKVRRLSEKAVDHMIAVGLTYSEMHEHAGLFFHTLSDLYEDTDCAYLTDLDEREAESHAMASFAIGLALGRRLAGGAR